MEKKLISTFPQRLKQCLDENPSFTATTLAEEIGLSKQAISMYISGDRKPKRPTLKAISDALGVNLAWLMGYDVEKVVPSIPVSITLNAHESKVIIAYRNKPEMQPAVDRLLEIESVEPFDACTNIHLIPIAAHNDDPSEEQQALMQDDLDEL